MPVPMSEQRILFQRTGNRCAFPTCHRILTAEGNEHDPPVVLCEIAHIVAEHSQGPRGQSPLTLKERNSYSNLILLCHQHHQLIDSQPQTYTVERLQQMRRDHEAWVEQHLQTGPSMTLTTEDEAEARRIRMRIQGGTGSQDIHAGKRSKVEGVNMSIE